MTHPLIDIAKNAVASWLERRPYHPPPLGGPWNGAHPVFVTLRSPDGALRGCIGHLAATHDRVADEVAECAVLAASSDPRFPPVADAELDGLSYEISVLEDPTPCTIDQLDPAEYGVVVTDGLRRGVLLPDLEGIDTVEQQLAIARRKAGIAPGEPISLERFRVVKIDDEESSS